jgi:hypothetical protein
LGFPWVWTAELRGKSAVGVSKVLKSGPVYGLP